MPTLVKVTTHQDAKTMVAFTRRGDTIYFAGSKGDTYEIRPVINGNTGEIVFTCSCPDYTGIGANGVQFRASKLTLGESCKHVRAAHAQGSATYEDANNLPVRYQ